MIPSVLASSVCWSLQCLISVLTQRGWWWTLSFRLTCSVVLWEGRDTSFKDNGLLFWVPDVLCWHSEVVCGIYSVFKCSFDEFVGKKMVSPSYSSAILGPPPQFPIFFLKSTMIFTFKALLFPHFHWCC